MVLKKDGDLSAEELRKVPGVPSQRRLKQRPCAVIECVQHIPCDPCQEACPSGAITIEGHITNLPVLDPEKCTGCGTCIPSCPGLAIFLVDLTYSKHKARISIPYEFLPSPKKGTKISVTGRKGETLCDSQVQSVRKPQKYDHTAVISFLVSKKYAMRARHIKIKGSDAEND
jgi:Fe-S-cluster-containing hydrogenase component 2